MGVSIMEKVRERGVFDLMEKYMESDDLDK